MLFSLYASSSYGENFKIGVVDIQKIMLESKKGKQSLKELKEEFEEKRKNLIGRTGGIAHFGFRLKDAKDIDEMNKRIIKAGGIIIEKGEFVKGSPYLFFRDPDGYIVEVWYELLL